MQQAKENLLKQSDSLKGSLYQLKNMAFAHTAGDCDPTGILEATILGL
jgi:hypothetical protein